MRSQLGVWVTRRPSRPSSRACPGCRSGSTKAVCWYLRFSRKLDPGHPLRLQVHPCRLRAVRCAPGSSSEPANPAAPGVGREPGSRVLRSTPVVPATSQAGGRMRIGSFGQRWPENGKTDWGLGQRARAGTDAGLERPCAVLSVLHTDLERVAVTLPLAISLSSCPGPIRRTCDPVSSCSWAGHTSKPRRRVRHQP
jgi:hypothetical protein